MPVHFGSLDGEVIFGGEVAPQGTDQDNEQEDDADGDVQTMEAGQGKET